MREQREEIQRRAAERFFATITDDTASYDQQLDALREFERLKGRKREKQALITPLVPALAEYAERVTVESPERGFLTRDVIVDAIRLAPRENAVEGLKRIKAVAPSEDERFRIQQRITDMKASLYKTRVNQRLKLAELGQVAG